MGCTWIPDYRIVEVANVVVTEAEPEQKERDNC
jgi:hypothetical protein